MLKKRCSPLNLLDIVETDNHRKPPAVQLKLLPLPPLPIKKSQIHFSVGDNGIQNMKEDEYIWLFMFINSIEIVLLPKNCNEIITLVYHAER